VVAGVDDVRLFAKDGVIDLDGELGGNVELPAQVANGKPALDRSSPVRDRSRSRDRGPMIPSTA
jgi:hypothetical protein